MFFYMRFGPYHMGFDGNPTQSRPQMDNSTMKIPLSELSGYDSGKSVVFEGGEKGVVEEWSLGDKMCYYLVFN